MRAFRFNAPPFLSSNRSETKMNQEHFPYRRRFTLVEGAVVIGLVILLVVVVLPVVFDESENTDQVRDLAAVQEAVRRYRAETGAYPSFAAAARPGQTLVDPWVAGELPNPGAVPAQAGLDFDAVALRGGVAVRFFPDYLRERPRHADERALDGGARWRIDAEGSVLIQLDGRSY